MRYNLLDDSCQSLSKFHCLVSKLQTTEAEKWICEFKRGRTSTNDAARSGRPKNVTTPEIIEKIHDIVSDDPKVKVCELAEAAEISIG